MAEYLPPLDDFNFALGIAGLEEVSKLNGYQHADPDTVETILDEAARFFSEVVAPLNRIGDQQGSVLLEDGTMKTPDGFQEAYAKYVEAGWAAAHMPQEWGGGGLPYIVGVAIDEMFKSACLAFSLCPTLTHGAAHALQQHASPELMAGYMEKLVSGEWAGAMSLTEPQAGSDVGALRAKAIKQDDGSYLVTGTKLFITWGDQDLTDNIIHLVLARTPDAAPGTRGISMFLVPKFLSDENGEVGERNDLKVLSIEHKLGIHASPTCVMSYGDSGKGAVGYIVGEEQAGMRNMFTMMNAARIGVGMEGVAISERAYQQARDYARDRIQGREIGGDSKESVAIVTHPDVRRMLLTMKAYTEAMRTFLYLTAGVGDQSVHGASEEGKQIASDRLSILTPILKAWCTDLGVEMASMGIQVHGGMGYVEETGAAQYLRDARIATIYEGTNGIQAMDLVLRRLPIDNGAAVISLITEIAEIIPAMGDHEVLGTFRDEMETGVQGLADTSAWLGEKLAGGDIKSALAGATPYLTQFGTVIGAWLMARSAVVALNTTPNGNAEFLEEKVTTARFYGEQLLPKAGALIPAIKSGNSILETARF